MFTGIYTEMILHHRIKIINHRLLKSTHKNDTFPLVFFRFIDGQVYDGVVKGTEKARQQYTEAVSRGQSAGLVRYNRSRF